MWVKNLHSFYYYQIKFIKNIFGGWDYIFIKTHSFPLSK